MNGEDHGEERRERESRKQHNENEHVGILRAMIDRIEAEQLLHNGVVAFNGQRDVITATGADVAEYLHGQVSQAVTSLVAGQSAWTLLLDPQGRIASWMRMTRVADDQFWLDMDAGTGEQALARLERFKLRVDATFMLSTMNVVAVRGPNADPTIAEGTTAVVASLEWPDTAGFDLLGEGAAIPEGVPEADETVLDAFRISLGIPAMGREILEKTIPAELGIVDMSADFTKGCYVGQELVARIDSRGNNTPRSIFRLELESEHSSDIELSLYQAGDEVGHITSLAMWGTGSVALASIKRAADIAAPMTAGASGATVTLKG